MTAHRLARIWKEGNRWHWYLVVSIGGDSGWARVWQGDEPTYGLAKESFLLTDIQQNLVYWG